MKKFFKIIIFISIAALFVFLFREPNPLNKNEAVAGKIFNRQEQENEITDYTKKIYTPGALRVTTKKINKDGEINNELKSAKITEITNEERLKNGNLPILTENAILYETAKEKVQDMFKRQYFEHISPQKIGVGDLALKNGYDYITIGENLALGDFENERALVNAWMNSKGHKANILNTKYTEIGIYAQKGIFNGNNVWIAVQHFGLPLSMCPQIDNTLKNEIEVNQNKADELSNNLEILKKDLDENSMLIYIYGSKKQEQAEKYNLLAEEYNNLVKETKDKIDEYNKQVQNLNDCIKSELDS